MTISIQAADPHAQSSAQFSVIVCGDCMAPKYPHGAILIVDPHKTPQHLNNVVVWRSKSRKRVIGQLIIKGARRTIKPLNPSLPGSAFSLTEDDLLLGTVIGRYLDD